MAFIITSPCIGEKSGDCVEVCPVDAIAEGTDQFYIDPETCIDCAACEPACPVSAIYEESLVPPEDLAFIHKNAHFFK